MQHPLRHWRIILGGVLGLAAVAFAQPAPDPAITPAEITAHVRYLASEELAGRGSGTPGCRKAAEYVAARFRDAGLKPAGDDGGYYQSFDVITGVTLGEPNRCDVRMPGGRSLNLKAGDRLTPVRFSSTGTAAAPLTFAGYGISQPDLKHDDYAGIEVKGRILLVLRGVPPGEAGRRLDPFASLRYKATLARDRGAAAVLFVTPTAEGVAPAAVPAEVESSFSESGIPAAILPREVAETILKSAGKDLSGLETTLAHGGTASAELPGVTANLRLTLRRERRQTANVLGRIDGSDPRLRDEVVIVGAHYDHLGMGGSGSLSQSGRPEIHPGADDNASGTAGLIELAQFLVAGKSRLGRSVLFIAFSGEEMGLLGSSYYVRNPTVPLSRTVAMVNLDMIGRGQNDTVQVIGAATSPAWQGILDAANQRAHLKLKPSGSGFGASDQTSFYARGVPVLFFFTGVHPDYHRPTDTWDKINAPAEARLLDMVADAVERIAALPVRPAFARVEEPASPGGRGFSVYLGSIPDYSDSENGVALTGVREGSPAEKGGLKAGDRIIRFAGRKIMNVQDYTFALNDARANVPVEVVVLRDGKQVTLTVVPAPRR